MQETINKLSESIKEKYLISRKNALHDLNRKLMLCLYDLGKRISESHSNKEHDSKFYEILSNALLEKMGKNRTFTVQNLKNLEAFYNLYQNYYSQFPFDYEKAMRGEFIPLSFYQIISLPWSFHKLIMRQCKDVHEALFYIEEAYFCKWDEQELVNHLEKNSFKDPNYKVDTTSRSLIKLLKREN